MPSIQGLATRWYPDQSIYLGYFNYGHRCQRLCPLRSHISVEEFSEQGGTAHLAPWERDGAGTYHCGKLLGEIINACKMAWESVTHFIRLGAAGERMLKAVLQPAVDPSSVELLLK